MSAHCPAGLLCQGGFCGAPPLPGDVIINEVITGPAEVAALEFKNVSDVTTNLSGCVLEIDHDAIEIDELPLMLVNGMYFLKAFWPVASSRMPRSHYDVQRM